MRPETQEFEEMSGLSTEETASPAEISIVCTGSAAREFMRSQRCQCGRARERPQGIIDRSGPLTKLGTQEINDKIRFHRPITSNPDFLQFKT